ncbi:MAG TPA: FtsX-like permease family protein [Pirellulales bacterium]|nr:FtsX-like permease family protein [Pirellulales bacterium]
MSRMLTVKLFRDLRAAWVRFGLMAIAIAVSLTVFGGVLCAWAVVGRETRTAYLGTEPASATILLEHPIEVERMTAVAAAARGHSDVIDATGRTQFTTPVEVNGHLREDVPMQVYVAAHDDPMKMSKFQVQKGSWPPRAGEIFIGRDSLTLLGANVGDVVTIESPNRERLRLRVAGIVYDPSLAPAPQHQAGHGYLSVASLASPREKPVLDQLRIQVAEAGAPIPSRDRDTVVQAAGDLAARLSREFGLEIHEIQVPEPYAHPHQRQADALLLSLVGGGAVALLLSAILVANMLGGVFTQQIPQIGIMKATGARAADVGRHYLAMTLLVAVAATVFALPPAAFLGRFLANMVFGFLGVDAISLAPPWWAWAVIFAAGVFLPPLMALPPLVRASRATVRSAIDHRGLASKPNMAAGLLSRLGRIRRLDRGLLMALRNTLRRPTRSLLAAGLLASAGAVFVAGMSMSSSLAAIDVERKEQRSWDVEVRLASPAVADEAMAIVERSPNVSRVDGYRSTPCGVAGPGRIPITRTYPDQGHGRVTLTAIPADAATFPAPTLIEGRWLEAGDIEAVVLNQITRIQTVPDVGVGEAVQLFVDGRPTSWRVAGIAQERQGGGGAYVTAEGLAAALDQPRRVNELRIVTAGHDERSRKAAAEAIAKALTDAGIEVESAYSVSRSGRISEGHLLPIILLLLAIAVAMGVVGGIGLASTMSANVLDRTREFGVLHAIGARPKTVRRIVIAEGVFLASISCLLATLPAILLTAALGAGLGNLFMYAPLPFRLSIPAVSIWIALVTLISLLATGTAAIRASRITVREALACI